MAAERLKKVTGHLTCPNCYGPYKKPKYLPCYHSYCEECLVKLVRESNITCPECRKTSVVPNGGVAQLPSNFFVHRLLDEVAIKRKVEGEEEAVCDQCTRNDPVKALCLDCAEFLCQYCIDYHKYSRKEYQSHSMMPLNELRSKKESVIIKPKPIFAVCQEHGLELIFYCDTCDQLVCQYCIMKDHLNHDHDTIKKMGAKHRKELDKIMEPVEKIIEGLSLSHKKVSNTRDKIEAQTDDADKEIDRYYEELHRRLQQQREDLKKELHEASRQKKKKLTLQMEQLKHSQAQLKSITELVEAIRNGSDQEALLMKKRVTDDVKKISDSYNKLGTQPVQPANIKFVPVEEYKKLMPQFGCLPYSDVCPVNCQADVPQWIFVNDRRDVKVITKDFNYYVCHKGGSKAVIQMQSSRGDITPIEVQDNQDGSYSASFVANQVGEVKLSITVNRQQIKDSPFSVRVRGKYTIIDEPSKIVDEGGRMGQPWCIAFGRDGMWAVTDDISHCVWIFDSEDQLVRKFGSCGTGNGKFNEPFGVAFDANNHLYVTDHCNHRVQKFDVYGTYLFQFGSKGSSNGQLHYPLCIEFHNSKLYIADSNNHRISVFQLDGRFSHSIGSGHLSNPYCIAVSNNNQLLVANRGHHCISIFSLDGNYVGKFGTRGTGRGQLNSPSGIATNMYGFILVTEKGNNRISIFDKDGILIHIFGSKGPANGQFSWPTALAISPTGDIYVSDKDNRRIQIFST